MLSNFVRDRSDNAALSTTRGLINRRNIHQFLSWLLLLVMLPMANVSFANHESGANSYNPVIPFRIVNETDQTVVFDLVKGECFQGYAPDQIPFSVPPNGTHGITLYRAQGDCNGHAGYFRLTSDYHSGDHPFAMYNDGHLYSLEEFRKAPGDPTPSDLESIEVSSHNGVSGNFHQYTWTFKDEGGFLKNLNDERLTMPRSYIAADSGRWLHHNGLAPPNDSGTQVNPLSFVPTPGQIGNFYDACSGVELFHPQQVVRLPNKDGRAYFMVAQSRSRNGYIALMQSDLNQIDENDLLISSGPGVLPGKYIWQDLYTGTFNGNLNPIGNWNHPGKMEVIGDVLVVTAQNWGEGAPCFYGKGSSEDMLLFYDIRDPEHPRYWGALTATQLRSKGKLYWLGFDPFSITFSCFEPTSGCNIGPYSQGPTELAAMSIVRSTTSQEWHLIADGADGRVTWTTKKISPNIEDWQFVESTGFPIITGQHGMNFNSYQQLSGSVDIAGQAFQGVERAMYFDMSSEDEDHYSPKFSEWLYSLPPNVYDPDFVDSGGRNSSFKNFVSYGWDIGPWVGAQRDWDADSIYITRKGMPIIYTMESAYGENGILYQAHARENFSLETPHFVRSVTNRNSSGFGSLRRAIGYGINIVFQSAAAPSISVDDDGPFVVSLYDANIDASNIAGGITLVGDGERPVILVGPENKLTMINIKTENDPLADVLNWGESLRTPWATSTSGAWFYDDYPGELRSGKTDLGGTSFIQTAVEGPGTLSFDWKLSAPSENSLTFYVENDGVIVFQQSITGEEDWNPESVPLAEGVNQLKWVYSQNVEFGSGKFVGYLGGVDFTPSAPAVTIPNNTVITAVEGLGYLSFFNVSSVTTTHSDAPVTNYSASGLPPGMAINPDTGIIHGSPTGPEGSPYLVTIYATNYGGQSVAATLTIEVTPVAITLREAIDYIEQPIPLYEGYGSFLGQDTTTNDDVDAAQSKSGEQESELIIDYWGPGVFKFDWATGNSSGLCTMKLYDELTPPNGQEINSHGVWLQTSRTVQFHGRNLSYITHECQPGFDAFDAGYVDKVRFEPYLPGALDTPPIYWQTTLGRYWFGQTQVTHEVSEVFTTLNQTNQRDAAQSALLTHDQATTLETIITGPGTLTFWWKVDSEANYDFLRFYVNNTEQTVLAPGYAGPDRPWKQITITLAAGPQALKWEYSKDVSDSIGADAAWVDQVMFTPAHPVTSPLKANGTLGVPFNYQLTAANLADVFRIDGLPPGLVPQFSNEGAGESDGLIIGTPTASGTYTVTVQAFNANNDGYPSLWGTTTSTVDITIDASLISTTTALDDPTLNSWTTRNPATAWWGQTTTTHDGTDAARSAGIDHGQSSDLETTVVGPGMLSFWWKVSSEKDHDYLEFTLFKAPSPDVTKISGTLEGWQQVTIAVPAGSHTLRWAYVKDAIGSDGEDAGWVDEIVYISGLVTNKNDSGAGSLRQIIADLPAGGTINFDSALAGGLPITLTSAQLALSKDVVISASDLSGGMTISGNNSLRVFSIGDAVNVTLEGMTIADGLGYHGGGIENIGGILTVIDSTLIGNHANGYGGGLFNFDEALTIFKRSTLMNNTTDLGGGAIYIGNDALSTVSLINTTLSGNSAESHGGAIRNYLGSIDLSHSTIVNNESIAGQGGGIYSGGGSNFSVENSIIADNTDASGKPDLYSNVQIDVYGENLIGDNAGVASWFPQGTYVGTTGDTRIPMVSALADNGGKTQTMSPLLGSLAINNGIDTSGIPGRGTNEDQRGQARPQGGQHDIGAIELVDTDGDGLLDIIELDLGLDPNNTDTDADGLSDGSDGYSPFDPNSGGIDQDGDGFADGEADFGTLPGTDDSDGDGTKDTAEITDVYGSDADALDPLVYRGDGNANEMGGVEAGDLVLCTRVMMGTEVQTPQYEFHCDAAPSVNDIPMPDGEIGAGDVLRIQQKALGM